MTRRAHTLGTWLLAAAAGCSSVRSSEVGSDAPDELLSAGGATVFDTTRDAFSLPLPGLDRRARARFFVGNSFFNQNWVTAPASPADRDGLGPLFNARSCSACHFKDGRGRAPDTRDELHMPLLRVSLPGAGEHGAPRPHPSYGDQIQSSAVPGVAPEARVAVDYVETSGAFADGERYSLHKPAIHVLDLAYGPLDEATLLTSARVAPALIGLGLLEAVPEADLTTWADPDDRDHDGISGRANRVWDASAGAYALGRFGWKAEQPSLHQQVAAALLGDMGITSRLFPRENCAQTQHTCSSLPSGGTPEIDDDNLQSLLRYIQTLGVPARRPLPRGARERGEQLFRAAGCQHCHLETLRTGPLPAVPQLAGVTIHPYTDLLLHDLGAELADGRPMFAADGREFRTAPLWGLGLVPKVNGHNSLLHDGRARGVAEAVLWHGGEAESAKRAFLAMPAADRRALLAFVESL